MALLSILTSVLSVLTIPTSPTSPTSKLDPVVSTPTPGGADVQAGRALPVSPGPSWGPTAPRPVEPREAPPTTSASQAGGGAGQGSDLAGGSTGLASWYPDRPATCNGVPVPAWVKAWTASLTLPCGSLVRLSGPDGTITVPVEDRGPEAWTGRLFDLNPTAFQAIAGNLWSGVVPVSWQPAA